MDAVWLLLAGGWWTVPAGVAAVGAGTLGWLGLRSRRRGARPMPLRQARRLELDAARHDLKRARDGVPRAQAAVQAARADLARVNAARHAGHADAADVATARRGVAQAQKDVVAAKATLTARRAELRVAYASRPTLGDGPDAMPLARLTATHEAINAEWIAYETDPHKAITYPSMSDVREPLTIEFLRAQQQAQWLRPSAGGRVAAADYAAYRAAVQEMARTFRNAEGEARRRAGERAADDPRGERWADIARDVVDGAMRSADAVRRAAEAWRRPDKR
jgi:hypothetical protein